MKYWSNFSENKLNKQIYEPLEDEKKTFEFWYKEKTLDKLLEFNRKPKNGLLTILNGPTFPTGSPHSGHIVNALIKDIFTRYAYQKELQVVNRFGWDCHGLPVEHEVDKKLEIKEPKDLYRIGVTKYNEECRKFVERHESDWKNNLSRIGVMTDLTGAYSTMSLEYMESVWGIFKQLFDKKLVYRDTKVLPYSTGCFTHLSHFESKYNLKNTMEVNAIVALQIEESEVSLLIWTDSPWKLAANFSVCVNPSSIYVKIQMVDKKRVYIVSKKRLNFVFPNSSDFSILEEFQGKHIANLKYQPLFDYLAGSFKILQDDSICDDVGTGIVALCPHFDQNEYRICLMNSLRPDETLCPIDSCGRFTRSIAQLGGLTIEEASLLVVQSLQEREQLVHLQNVERKKPHCWRSDVPLIEKVATTWFIKVESLKEKLKENNSNVNWVPSSSKDVMNSHFDELTDWPIGRDRHWGTPIPIWTSPSGNEIRCIGSVKELLELTNAKDVSDLHKEFLDRVVIPSTVPGNLPLRRIPDVFDCWFESATMPVLQQQQSYESADLLVEGQDQLLGWFLTTSILSAALSLPAPAKTIVAHGLVQGTDQMKLSKRKHNHNDAIKIAEKYGVDALRLYLSTTPLVAGQSIPLDESEARKFNEKLFQPMYKILYDLVPHLGKIGWVTYGIARDTNYLNNIFVKWILLRTEQLLQFYESELKDYRLHLVIPKLIDFLEEFHKWFIPAMRISFTKNDQRDFIAFSVVYKTCLVVAPFAPCFAEYFYQLFKPWTYSVEKEYIAMLPLLEKSDGLLDSELEVKITRWQGVVEMINEARRKHIIPIGYRITELIVVHPLEEYLDNSEVLDETLKKMVNVHEVIRTRELSQFGTSLKVKLKKDSSLQKTLSDDKLEKVALAIQNFDVEKVGELIRVGSEDVLGEFVTLNDVEISHTFEKEADDGKSIIMCRNDVIVVVKMNKNLKYYEEGTRMEMISVVQKFRKKAKVYPSELVTVCYLTEDSCMERAFEKFSDELRKTTNSKIKPIADVCGSNEEEILQETVDIKGAAVILYLFKECENKE